jgi:hypothetical protein
MYARSRSQDDLVYIRATTRSEVTINFYGGLLVLGRVSRLPELLKRDR